MISYVFRFLLALSLVVITVFAFAPGPLTPAWIVNHDKFSHMMVFLCLGLLVKLSFPKLNLVFVIGLLVVFAVLIEVLQYKFFNRGFSLEDIKYDLLGIGLFLILFKGFSVLKLKQGTQKETSND